jgi:dihydroorotate dehydrogenase
VQSSKFGARKFKILLGLGYTDETLQMSKLFEKVARPLLFRLDPEKAHELGLKAIRVGLGSAGGRHLEENASIAEAFGPIERFGLKFANPLGIAAGFDKNGVVVNELSTLGFGFVEVGTVTFEPQPGNPKPRIFRLPKDKALINRLGFNNEGAMAISERLANLKKQCVVGVNIGRTKDVANEDAVENYLKTFNALKEVSDYVAINISSPNTPNLRELQSAENLEHLIGALQEANRHDSSIAKPLLVKIAPDLTEDDIAIIVDTCIRFDVAGIIATNTTVNRDRLKTAGTDKLGPGGLSGRPLRARSTQVISQIYRHSRGRLPIVGVGGIFTAEDAFEKIVGGASLLQAYTGFIYSGPSFAYEILLGLAKIIRERSFKSLDEAVGSAAN